MPIRSMELGVKHATGENIVPDQPLVANVNRWPLLGKPVERISDSWVCLCHLIGHGAQEVAEIERRLFSTFEKVITYWVIG